MNKSLFIHCPSCGGFNEVPEHYIGKNVRCMKCARDFVANPAGTHHSNPPPVLTPLPAQAQSQTDSRTSEIYCGVIIILAIIVAMVMMSRFHSDEANVNGALQGLHSLEDATKALEGSATRTEYYRIYEERSPAISSFIQKINDPKVKEPLSNLLDGYKLMAKTWDPATKKEAVSFSLGRISTLALPIVEEYARASPSERRSLDKKREERPNE